MKHAALTYLRYVRLRDFKHVGSTDFTYVKLTGLKHAGLTDLKYVRLIDFKHTGSTDLGPENVQFGTLIELLNRAWKSAVCQVIEDLT